MTTGLQKKIFKRTRGFWNSPRNSGRFLKLERWWAIHGTAFMASFCQLDGRAGKDQDEQGGSSTRKCNVTGCNKTKALRPAGRRELVNELRTLSRGH